MSNPAVITLADVKNRIAGFDRLQVEDNIGEAIHLHLGPARLDFTIKQFFSLAEGMRAALDGTGRFAPFRVEQFDPLFLLSCGPLLEHLQGIDVQERFIDDMRCIVYRSRKLGVYRFVPVAETPAYLFLAKQDDSFLEYSQNSYLGMANQQRLLKIADEIQEHGYPYEGRYIVLFQGQNLVRDGQHRAAALRHLRGNARIPVLVFKFSVPASLPIISWRACAALPAHFLREGLSWLRSRLRTFFPSQ